MLIILSLKDIAEDPDLKTTHRDRRLEWITSYYLWREYLVDTGVYHLPDELMLVYCRWKTRLLSEFYAIRHSLPGLLQQYDVQLVVMRSDAYLLITRDPHEVQRFDHIRRQSLGGRRLSVSETSLLRTPPRHPRRPSRHHVDRRLRLTVGDCDD